jgi:hypothetical protein
MSRNKLVIVVLVLIAALYVVSLAMGFRFNVDSRSPPDRDEVKDSWVKYLRDPLSIFAPNLLRCNDQPVDEHFILSQRRNRCEVEVPGRGDGGMMTATLQVLTQGVTVYERSDAPGRNPDCRSDAQLKPGIGLKVEYLPDGKTPRTPVCWLDRGEADSVGFVVLSDGGRLTLTCEGCGVRTDSTVRLRFEGEEL